MKKQFKFTFDTKIELPMQLVGYRENNDGDLILTFDFRKTKKELEKMGNSKEWHLQLENLMYRARGWKSGIVNKKNGVINIGVNK